MILYATTYKNLSVWIFIAALLVITKHWREPKCPPIGEWVNKLWYTHAMDYTQNKKEWTNDTCHILNGPQGLYV